MKRIGEFTFDVQQARIEIGKLDERIASERHGKLSHFARIVTLAWLELEEQQADPKVRAAFGEAHRACKAALMALAEGNAR